MIAGQPKAGSTPSELEAERLRGVDITLPAAVHLSHIAVLLDGGGPNTGAALISGVVVNSAGDEVARGEPVSVADGADASWVQLRFAAAGGLLLEAGDYGIAMDVQGVTLCARTFVDDPGLTGGSWEAGVLSLLTEDEELLVSEDDEVLTIDGYGVYPLTAGLPIIVSLFEPWTDPAVDDLALSRLPFDLAQASLGATGVLSVTRTAAVAGWHGAFVDAERGSVAIVRSNGPLATLVGERVKVATRDGQRSVAVFVHDEQDFPFELAAEDLSLSRRAFLALAPWSTDDLDVIVETFG